jgi:hypothetical protein
MQFRFLAVLTSLLVLTTTACETAAPPPRLPQMSFAHLTPIKLDVTRIETVSEFQPSFQPPNVEHLFPTSPEMAARRWIQDRVQPTGRGRLARFIIHEASAVETKLKTDKGFGGSFKNEQSERYDLALSATLQILDERHMPVANANARVTRSRTVLEDTSLAKREQIWFEITEAMLKDFDREIEANIRQYMAPYIR